MCCPGSALQSQNSAALPFPAASIAHSSWEASTAHGSWEALPDPYYPY